MKFNINVITRDNEVKQAFLHNEQLAMETVNELNKQLANEVEDVWLYYKLDEIEAEGMLNIGRNYISVLMEYGEPVYCYLNNIKKAENDFARLVKDGKEDNTYELIRYINLEVGEYECVG